MVRRRNDGRFATCTSSTVPRRRAGSSSRRTRCSAMIGATSSPWVPAISARVGPGSLPRTMVSGTRVPESTPAGTSMNPEPISPGRAAADPIWSVPGCCAEARAVQTNTATSTAGDRISSRWRKTLTYLVYVAGIVIVGPMWFAWVESFTTIVGFLSAGLAIALKDPVSNLAGWAFILWRRPFEVGDRVQIGPHAGDVIDLGLFQFTINEIGAWVQADQSSGRIIHVPNGKIFTDPVANYNKGFKYIWNEVPVLVTFETDWRKAKHILTTIAVKHAEHLTAQAEQELLAASQQYLINYRKLTPIVYTKVVDSGVQLTLPAGRRTRGPAPVPGAGGAALPPGSGGDGGRGARWGGGGAPRQARAAGGGGERAVCVVRGWIGGFPRVQGEAPLSDL